MNITSIDKGSLQIIGIQLERIEKRDENYMTNPKWLRLRAKQDMLYKRLAQKEIEYFKQTIENNADVAEKNKSRIADYERFIKNQEGKETIK